MSLVVGYTIYKIYKSVYILYILCTRRTDIQDIHQIYTAKNKIKYLTKNKIMWTLKVYLKIYISF